MASIAKSAIIEHHSDLLSKIDIDTETKLINLSCETLKHELNKNREILIDKITTVQNQTLEKLKETTDLCKINTINETWQKDGSIKLDQIDRFKLNALLMS
ncbi:unnamed protein product [Brachionus calyciflorus]|uniref:Uncharacterized protein n=1 Tax=Brachionus calyciflorus TaxID=104777 RepID=A0A814GQP6_9BILA|nr:unnamed protein product [Brachionus calyciflorus]